jgi:hypothetical protein
MSQSSFIDAKVDLAESSRAERCHVARASLAQLRDLEASLQASQQALLRRDCAGVELGTLEQRRLQQALELLWDRNPVHSHRDDSQGDGRPQPNLPSPSASGSLSGLAGELRAAELRVLHLGSVQAILLDRAQRSLVMLANLVAGSGATYGPPVRAAWPIDPVAETGKGSRCRA